MTYCGQGHNRDEAEAKAQGGIPVQEVREEAERDEDEQDVQIRAKEEELVRLQPRRLALGAEGVGEAPEERLRWLGAIAVFQERRTVGHSRHVQERYSGKKRESVRCAADSGRFLDAEKKGRDEPRRTLAQRSPYSPPLRNAPFTVSVHPLALGHLLSFPPRSSPHGHTHRHPRPRRPREGRSVERV